MKTNTHKNIASQKRSHSMVETVASTIIGFVINVYAQHVIFPILGINIPISTNLFIAVLFTGISVARGYLIRRLFNWVHVNWDRLKSFYQRAYVKLAGY